MPCKITAGIGHGAKSMRTVGVRSTAAPKGINIVWHPADGLDLAGSPPRLPAVPPRPYSARSLASQACLLWAFSGCPLRHDGDERRLIEGTTIRAPHARRNKTQPISA
jgi:hypothetical protein